MIKVYKIVRLELEVSIEPPPPKARVPVVRQAIDGSDESEQWVAQLARDMNAAEMPLSKPAKRPFKIAYVGAPTTSCGTRHLPAYDPASDQMTCAVCKTRLERTVVNT